MVEEEGVLASARYGQKKEKVINNRLAHDECLQKQRGKMSLELREPGESQRQRHASPSILSNDVVMLASALISIHPMIDRFQPS